ncbi:MAG: DNRLRE domain-containing protein [Gemmatimonadales bacterium]
MQSPSRSLAPQTAARSAVPSLILLSAGLALAASTPAAAQRQLEITASADTRVQGGSATVNFGNDATLWLGNPDKTIFLWFDLSAVPAGARVTDAELVLTFAADNGQGANAIEIGGVQQRWDELQLTFSNQPTVAWSGRRQSVSANGPVRWDVRAAVAAWLDGSHRNNGLALRGDGPLKGARSREYSGPTDRPRLRIRYEEAAAGSSAPALDIQTEMTTTPAHFPDVVGYQARLRHHGDQTVPVTITEVLTYPEHTFSTVDVQKAGGATGTAVVDLIPSGTTFRQRVTFTGSMPPQSTVTLGYQVHVHPACTSGTETIHREVTARSGTHSPVTTTGSFRAACAGYQGPYIESEPTVIAADPAGVFRIGIRNRHATPVILGLFKPGTDGRSITQRVKLAPGEFATGQQIPAALTEGGKVGFCFLFDDDQKSCPDRTRAPGMFGELAVRK